MRIVYKYLLLALPIYIQAQPAVKVQAGAHITTADGAIITLTDMSLDNGGTINQLAGQGRFVFSGTTNSSISGTTSPTFDELEIAKTGSGYLTLKQGINIGSGIFFTAGNIDLNNNNILLQSDALLNGESATSRIIGSNGGYVQILTSLNAPVNANPGNLGIVITTTQNPGLIRIRRGHHSQSNAFSTSASILRYYDMAPVNNTGLQATLRINYFDSELNGLDENKLVLYSSADNRHWTVRGFSARSALDNYVEQTTINTFNRFTLSEVDNALPLVWGTFHTQCENSHTTISWKTLQEQNTANFVIRRSTNGIAWTTIGQLPAAGFSQSTLNYSFTDPDPSSGKTWYQILQQDLDGKRILSPVLISRCAWHEDMQVYPNPVNSSCVVSISSMTAAPATLRLYSYQGALLQQQAFAVKEGTNQLVVSLNNYPVGTYLLTICLKDTVKTIKLKKQ